VPEIKQWQDKTLYEVVTPKTQTPEAKLAYFELKFICKKYFEVHSNIKNIYINVNFNLLTDLKVTKQQQVYPVLAKRVQ